MICDKSKCRRISIVLRKFCQILKEVEVNVVMLTLCYYIYVYSFQNKYTRPTSCTRCHHSKGIQILPPAHSFWRITPIGGLPLEYTSYECAGPNLTKIQFQVPPRSRGDHFQNSSWRVEPLFPSASQGEWSRMVPRPIEVAFLTSATPIWGMGVVSPFTYIYTYNNSI